MSIIIPANSAVGGGFDVANSARFNKGSSDSLTRTQSASPTHDDKGTLSFWFKRSLLGVDQYVFSVFQDSNNRMQMNIKDDDQLKLLQKTGGSTVISLITNRVFRDVSAWYHVVVAIDTTQGTASNRIKIYINGVQETSFGTETYPDQNENVFLTKGTAVSLGAYNSGSGDHTSAYFSEIVMVDGQQLAADSFGEFDGDDVWRPIDVSGLTFGSNGYYLDFQSSGALGNDVSGNNNDFTANNLTAIDQTTDTPTNNFCTMNPLDTYNSPTITDGNTIINAGGSDKSLRSTIGISSGKWYWEVNTTANNSANMGIINGEAVLTDGNSLQSVSTNSVIWEGNGGLLFKNGSSVTSEYGGGTSTYGFAFDLDAGTLKLSQNGTFYNSGSAVVTSISANTYFPFFAPNGGGSPTEFKANFGNPAYAITSSNTDANGYGNFEYAVPSGYYALNSKNLAEFG